MNDLLPWELAGTYLESCNCEAICPCRRIGGRPGGRSTYGVCLGTLSWNIADGRAGDVDLGGLNVVLAQEYSDDEEGSPWTWILYVDEEGTPAARLKERAIEVDREVDAVDVAALESRIDDPEEHECGGRRPDGNHATIGLPAQEGIPVLGLPPPRAEGDNRERERREQDRP